MRELLVSELFADVTLIASQAEDADGALGDQVEDGLVVLVRDKVPLDLLADVHLLLELEDCEGREAGVRGGGGG